jgi:hypothetical protein
MTRLSRRSFLKATGGMIGALPLLESLEAGAATTPKRLIIFFHPNGTVPHAWFPTAGASETDFTFSAIHQPLLPHKADLIFTTGIDMDSDSVGPGEPHQRGMGAVLTGTRLQQGTMVGGDGSLAGWADGISVDQEIANAIGTNTRFASLQLGVRATGSDVRMRMSYSGPARPLPPENDPLAVYQQVFSGFTQTPAELDRLRLQRRSVLDAVRGQFSSLRSKISTPDRLKLDAHLELVRDMERRLDILTTAGAACVTPAQPPMIDAVGEDNMPLVAGLQADLMVMALACDLTRVASLQHSTGANNIRFPFLQSYADDHQLSHSGDNDTTSQNEWIMRQTWYSGRFAHLLERLKSIPEGAGTMLDNTLILWVSDIAVGNTHSHKNMPFILAGRAGGALRTGRFLSYTNTRHNDLLTAILAAMDVPRPTFGDPAFNNMPLNLG